MRNIFEINKNKIQVCIQYCYACSVAVGRNAICRLQVHHCLCFSFLLGNSKLYKVYTAEAACGWLVKRKSGHKQYLLLLCLGALNLAVFWVLFALQFDVAQFETCQHKGLQPKRIFDVCTMYS